jgi:hypothetical protein
MRISGRPLVLFIRGLSLTKSKASDEVSAWVLSRNVELLFTNEEARSMVGHLLWGSAGLIV